MVRRSSVLVYCSGPAPWRGENGPHGPVVAWTGEMKERGREVQGVREGGVEVQGMQVSTVLHHLVAVSTELQLGAVFTSKQSIHLGREQKVLCPLERKK